MPSNETPDEFLYVDTPRLDSYVEQITSPVTYDKVPTWKAEIGLTGPKAETAQARYPRQMTKTEKIRCLDDHLRKQGLLAKGRVTTGLAAAETVFRFETCTAVKIFVPATAPESLAPEDSGLLEELIGPARLERHTLQETIRERQIRNLVRSQREQDLHAARQRLEGFKGLTIWFSAKSEAEPKDQANNNQLFLIPDLRQPDEPVSVGSGYSALVALYEVAGGHLQKTVLHSLLQNEIHNPVSTFQKAFIRDPLLALRDMGATVTGERIITSLYRLRRVFPPGKDGGFITIGYPISIIAADAFGSPVS